jgi:hypothetical protein
MNNIDSSSPEAALHPPPAAFVACLVSGWAIWWCLDKFITLIDVPISSLSILQIALLIIYPVVMFISWKVLLFFATEMKKGLLELKTYGTKWQFISGLFITFFVTPISLGLIWFMYIIFSNSP